MRPSRGTGLGNPLEQLDARRVALPHGTEVVTRVEAVHADRTIPQGSVGRVVSSAADRVTVRFVGVGDVEFARGDLSARREGQALFALRRADAWESLRGCIVLQTRVGSHAWGLADATSDEDVRGVFAPPFAWSTGLVRPPEDLSSDDGCESYWSVEKTLRQGLRCDPNTLEMLFVPEARVLDPIGQWVLDDRDAFVSREIFGSFGRYAVAQLERLQSGARLHRHRALLIGWLRDDPDLELDETAARLASASMGFATGDATARAREHIKQLYRSLFDQGLIASNDFAAFVAFAREGSSQLDLPRELRPKNAYNLLRLIHTAAAWLRDGVPRFRFGPPLLDRLRLIKAGRVMLDDVVAEAREAADVLDDARANSPLPERTDLARADALLRRVAEEVARRHVHGVPGPFGRDAPPVADAVWEDER